MRKYLYGGLILLCCIALVAPAEIRAESPPVNCGSLPPRIPITFDSIGVVSGYISGNDCWGWLAPDGTEYGIYGAREGTAFIDIATLTEKAFLPGAACIWRDIKTYQHYAYVVSECGTHGIQIIDMQYLPDSVHLVGEFVNGSARSHNLSIDTARGFLYACRRDYSGFRVIDLANPEAPVELNWVFTGDIHDVVGRNDTVWVAEGNLHQWSIWDMTNKANPQRLAHITVPGNGYVHNIWPSRNGDYVVTTEETYTKTIKIWNTSDLSNVSKVAELLAPNGLAHNAHVEGNYLFLSHYESGVMVIDFTYPDCPVEMHLFDTYPANDGHSYNGCWGIYPHAGTGHIYGSNTDGRFFVFETNIQETDFFGTPLLGDAPLAVDFTDLTLGVVNGRVWRFGDGDSTSVANPIHVYGPGLYSVELNVVTPVGEGLTVKNNYVTALAETLVVADNGAFPGEQVSWDIALKNNVPIRDIKLPVSISNFPAMGVIDSISRVGTRTDYFEFQQTIYSNPFLGEMTVRLKADNGGGSPPLPAGSGTIARLYMTLKPDIPPGTVSTFSTVAGGHSLTASTWTTSFAPAQVLGTFTVQQPPCFCGCHGDPECDGVSNVLDLVHCVNVAFRSVDPTYEFACPAAWTDVDCSGLTDVLDVVKTVNVTFRSADKAATYCDPCAP